MTKIVNDNVVYARLVLLFEGKRDSVTDEVKDEIQDIVKDEEKA